MPPIASERRITNLSEQAVSTRAANIVFNVAGRRANEQRPVAPTICALTVGVVLKPTRRVTALMILRMYVSSYRPTARPRPCRATRTLFPRTARWSTVAAAPHGTVIEIAR